MVRYTQVEEFSSRANNQILDSQPDAEPSAGSPTTRPILRALRSQLREQPSAPSPHLFSASPQPPAPNDGAAHSPIFPDAANPVRGDHPPNSTTGITATPVQRTKVWQNFISHAYRNHLVQQFVDSIFPVLDWSAMMERRLFDLIAFGKTIECDVYEMANSKTEYCHLLMEKLYKIQKELEEKRQKRIEQLLPQQRWNCPTTTQPQSFIGSMDGPIDLTVTRPHSPLSELPGNNFNFQPQIPVSSPSLISTDINNAMTLNIQPSSPNSNPQFSMFSPQTPPPTSSFEMDMDTGTSDVPSTPSTSTLPSPNIHNPKKRLFNSEDLKAQLLPILEKLWHHVPESRAFRHPIDPVALRIPDYFDKIRRPMHLSKIRETLESDTYTQPWEFIDDVWLMFDNAWLYNRKKSSVYRYCSKLSKVFVAEIDPLMKSLGYCCGRKYKFNPQTLYCCGKQPCIIPRDGEYYSYLDSYTYNYCQKCFNDIKGDAVSLGNDPSQPSASIKKEQFMVMKNDHLELEPFVDCIDCGRKVHQICVQYLDSIWPQGFTCDNCLKAKNMKRKKNKFNAKSLSSSKLGTHIETRVNDFLTKKDAGAGEVFIRVVSSSDKIVEVQSGMKQRFVDNGDMEGTFPYRAKAIFAFQKVDGMDVCFFGMHVQEYGSDCPAPNTRRVYIAYIDSIHFFRPRELRTAVYHEILLGYMEYVKQLGYTMAHIWACPPAQGDDYIFYSHPQDQKIPEAKRLQVWYKMMLDKGITEKIVVGYKDIHKQAIEDKLTSMAELPYFEGDFWPNILETSIKELDQEEEQNKREAKKAAAAPADSENDEMEASVDEKRKGQKKRKKSNKGKNKRKSNARQTGNDLTSEIFAIMEKHKDSFCVIRLHSKQYATSLGPIQDPDPVETCDLMDTRDAFLTLARDKYYEFSCLSRAKFSTMAMLYELHNQGQDGFAYTCDNCKSHVETRYHCPVCDDFDLCIVCYGKQGHAHKMERLGLDLDDDSSPVLADAKRPSPRETRKLKVQSCLNGLVHTSQCRDTNCEVLWCQKMKRVVAHARVCKEKTNGGCPICKQLIVLCCNHAKHCIEANCPVLSCTSIKHKFLQLQAHQRVQQNNHLSRRMQIMKEIGGGSGSASTSPALVDS